MRPWLAGAVAAPAGALLAAALAAATLAATLAVVVLPASPAAAQGEVVVELTGIEPAYVTPEDPLTVRGTVRNGTTAALEEAVVSLRLQRTAPISRRSLDAWLDEGNEYRTFLLDDQSAEQPVPPGGALPFELTVDAGGLPLSASVWGPRGLEVRVAGTSDGVAATARTRTLTVWAPSTTAQPTAVSVLLPLAPTAREWEQAAVEGTAVADAAAPRVRALLAAAQALPEVAWALDPALLSTRAPDEAITPAPTATPEGQVEGEAGSLVGALREALSGRDVLALPYADADVAALSRGEWPGLLPDATARGEALRAEAGVPGTSAVGWSAAQRPDQATVSALAAQGAEAVVLPAALVEPATPLPYTATGRASVSTDAGAVDALLADDRLSAALGGVVPDSVSAGSSPDDDGAAAPEPGAALAARQYLLASSAMITAERPSDPRAVLVVLDRAVAEDAAGVADRVSALLQAPWVRPLALSAFADLPVPGVDRGALPAELVEDGEAGRALLESVVRARADLAAFAGIAPDPAALIRGTDDVLLQVTSAAWRTEVAGRATFAAQATRGVSRLEDAVGVVDSATVNLINTSGELPVTVRNGLDQPVQVLLRLTADDPALQLPEPVPVQVEPASEQAVAVPVRAVGRADVTIVAELTNAVGEPVGSSAAFDVRVRADWENVGTAVIATLVGAAFVIGLVRNIRRGRRAEPLPAAGTDAGEGG